MVIRFGPLLYGPGTSRRNIIELNDAPVSSVKIYYIIIQVMDVINF